MDFDFVASTGLLQETSKMEEDVVCLFARLRLQMKMIRVRSAFVVCSIFVFKHLLKMTSSNSKDFGAILQRSSPN
jgi:hypothetical protein